jgi:hypothetical protein
VSERHEQWATGDTASVTNPAPQRPANQPIGAGCTLVLILGGVLVLIAIIGSLVGDDEPNSDEQLCSLLHGGWTSNELIYDDAWVDWPERQSPLERSIQLAKAAERGGCFELV